MSQPDDTDSQAAVQQLANGYWTTQIIYVAAKLGIADLLETEPRSVNELAKATGTHSPSLYRVMRALAGLGLFRENDDGQFETTTRGRCLASGSPGALRARAILNGEDWYRAWGGLLHSVQTGETAFDHMTGRSFFEYLGEHPSTAEVFNETMASATQRAAEAVAAAYDFSGCDTIVDVGGGTGAFLAGILRANPSARGVLFDQPEVAAAAPVRLADAGVGDRCEIIGGDFFDAVPAGGDVYILSWILHDWDDDRAIRILTNCRRGMGPNGRVLVLEQVIPPGDEPSLSKLYDLHMLVLAGGRERREDEFRALLGAAELELRRIIPTAVPRSIVEAAVSRPA